MLKVGKEKSSQDLDHVIKYNGIIHKLSNLRSLEKPL